MIMRFPNRRQKAFPDRHRVHSHAHFGGLPWYLLGHSQHEWLSVIQIVDLAGVPAVTFLVAAANGVLAEWLFRVSAVRSWFSFGQPPGRLIAQSVVVRPRSRWRRLWRLAIESDQFADGPVVALLRDRSRSGCRAIRGRMIRAFLIVRAGPTRQTMQLTKEAVQMPRRPDLIIWPETTFEYDLKEPRIRRPPTPNIRGVGQGHGRSSRLFARRRAR